MNFPRPLRALALASLLALAAPATAQDLTVGFSPRTGDVWVDTWLGDVNRYGSAYREPFVDELVRYHRAPRDLVDELLRRPGWTPGDVYFACSLAAVIGRPCRYVVDEYERDRGAGWGALAQRMGIKPGSAEFHRLKRGFVPTYDRWSRPIQLDAELERAYPGRAKGKASGPGGKSARGDGRPATEPRRGPSAEKSRPARDTGPAKARDSRGEGGKPKRDKGDDGGGNTGKKGKGGNGKGKG